MRYLIAVLVLFMVGCGTDSTTYIEVPTPQTLEGSYVMQDSSGMLSGPIEIVVAYDGEVIVSQASNNDKLVSLNFNNTAGLHPLIRFNGAFADDGLCFSKNLDVNYSATEDLEKDGSTSNLSVGRHFTTYLFCLDKGVLSLDITIFDGSSTSSGGVNAIVIERSFKSVN